MRPKNFKTLPVKEKRTIIEAEIKEIESKANNGRNAKKIQRKKAELNALENPDVVVDVDDDDTMSEHGSIVSDVSHESYPSNTSSERTKTSNVINASEIEFIEFLDDPEVSNYNKIQYLKTRYLHLQSQSKFEINSYFLLIFYLLVVFRCSTSNPQKHVTVT